MNSNLNEENWQQALIETNLLIIGYNAWNGYLKTGRGVVVCTTNSPLLDRFGETFKSHFVPRTRLAAFLNAWLATPDTVILQGHHVNGHILEAVDNYNPEQDVILLLESGKKVSFFNLKNLPIAPPESYQRVCFAWSEFQPSSSRYLAP
ncbi:MAG: hypothetical protein SAL07_20490 [Oscillatoria sp. PMC 1051.18]|uniref:hypothetical protein n=1 Tax=Oscillatoria salina TaxID=331517 RepID=UPI0013BC8D06|nr:hypothetical protein [Oscillatoria salina]MBZ8181127.1 hypothetical protein [Oscillatoria salina IIICB1]MEC4895147.1 hypothetical protein [Oscillatoria sp. PMC 1050.18]MEC5032285.1 hypothetical protein [Oscillatoria sp. PMC 1051.18]NET88752.1 hypothetical protein [Kamptonema sp. SIO1D9]